MHTHSSSHLSTYSHGHTHMHTLPSHCRIRILVHSADFPGPARLWSGRSLPQVQGPGHVRCLEAGQEGHSVLSAAVSLLSGSCPHSPVISSAGDSTVPTVAQNPLTTSGPAPPFTGLTHCAFLQWLIYHLCEPQSCVIIITHRFSPPKEILEHPSLPFL